MPTKLCVSIISCKRGYFFLVINKFSQSTSLVIHVHVPRFKLFRLHNHVHYFVLFFSPLFSSTLLQLKVNYTVNRETNHRFTVLLSFSSQTPNSIDF